MNLNFVKIVVFVPSTHADQVRKALSEAGCGDIGNYDFCSFSVKGVGRFRPLPGAHPFIGEKPASSPAKVEEVEEERIETICPREKLESALQALKKAHPYEEPAVDVYQLLNKGQL